MFLLGPDTTEYYLLTPIMRKVENWNGHEMLVVDPEALTVLARQATHDNAFMLRREHNQMVAKILSDPEASANDKYVALTMLRNAEVAAKGQLPSVRTRALPLCTALRGSRCGPDATTRRSCRTVSTRHIQRTICAIRRTLR